MPGERRRRSRDRGGATLAAAAQVNPPGCVEQGRELSEAVALAPRRDPGQLTAYILESESPCRRHRPLARQ